MGILKRDPSTTPEQVRDYIEQQRKRMARRENDPSAPSLGTVAGAPRVGGVTSIKTHGTW